MAGTGPKFALSLGFVNPSLWTDLAVAADELGFDSVWVPEHLVLPVALSGSPNHGDEHPPVPPHIPVPDAFVHLSVMAGLTKRIGLGTFVYNIGLRHPFVVARAAATLDQLSGGRLEFGIGASWMREEWDAVGLDFATRGRRVDEAIDVCKRLWSDDVIEHHGEFFDFDPVMFNPKPVSNPLRLHIGGDGKAAVRRAAQHAAGWAPMNHTLEALPEALERLDAACEKYGRSDRPEITLSGAIEGDADVERFVAAGVDRILITPWTSTKNAIAGAEAFAARYLA